PPPFSHPLVDLQLLLSHSVLASPTYPFAIPRSPTTFARTSDSRRIRTSSEPSLISVPPYLEKMTSSPSSTSILMYSPSSSRGPGPTASTRPRWGFSLAVAGSTIPLAVVSSSSRTSTIKRSPSGWRFIRYPSVSADFVTCSALSCLECQVILTGLVGRSQATRANLLQGDDEA